MNSLAGSEKGAAGGNLWYLRLNRKDAILHPPSASSVNSLWKKVFLTKFIHKLLKLGLYFMNIKPYYSWTPCKAQVCYASVCESCMPNSARIGGNTLSSFRFGFAGRTQLPPSSPLRSLAPNLDFWVSAFHP